MTGIGREWDQGKTGGSALWGRQALKKGARLERDEKKASKMRRDRNAII